MSVQTRCTKHGMFLPCVECVIEEGWAEARAHAAVAGVASGSHRCVVPNEAPMPAGMKHQAAKMLEGILDPIKPFNLYAEPETILWELRNESWVAVLSGGLELTVYPILESYGPPVVAKLYGGDAELCDKEVEGTEVEQKAAAIAMAADFLTRMLSRLPLVTG